VLVEEVSDFRIGLDAICELREAVAFVVEDQFPDGHAVVTDLLDDLFGFVDWNARVVFAVKNEQRRFDLLDVVDRRDFLEKVAILGERAVLGLAEFAPPVAGVLEEGDEVGDADDVDRQPRGPGIRSARRAP